jgi:DNA-binding CsgD family transcriptional regulator
MREPRCATHPGSLVRRYRTHGPHGPGVYPQCVPLNGQAAHLLEWPDPAGELGTHPGLASLTPSELDVLHDASCGMTVIESAGHRSKSPETVKSQRKSIALKLDARNTTHAVGIASRNRPGGNARAA